MLQQLRQAVARPIAALTPKAAEVFRDAPQVFARPTSVPVPSTAVPAWVFLGPPGVGKGTYASRVAHSMNLPHISAGDLVRHEIKQASPVGRQMAAIVNSGNLLPDSIILEVLQMRLAEGRQRGEDGVLLDGFPRTRRQAELLSELTDVQLALNLHLDESVLVAKCLGRRICTHCGKNYNVADINIPPTSHSPEIVLPPLLPPTDCEQYMERRADDTLDVIKKRLEVYHSEAQPVEDFFRQQGTLLDFHITGGIPETLPVLLDTLRPYSQILHEAHEHAEAA